MNASTESAGNNEGPCTRLQRRRLCLRRRPLLLLLTLLLACATLPQAGATCTRASLPAFASPKRFPLASDEAAVVRIAERCFEPLPSGGLRVPELFTCDFAAICASGAFFSSVFVCIGGEWRWSNSNADFCPQWRHCQLQPIAMRLDCDGDALSAEDRAAYGEGTLPLPWVWDGTLRSVRVANDPRLGVLPEGATDLAGDALLELDFSGSGIHTVVSAARARVCVVVQRGVCRLGVEATFCDRQSRAPSPTASKTNPLFLPPFSPRRTTRCTAPHCSPRSTFRATSWEKRALPPLPSIPRGTFACLTRAQTSLIFPLGSAP